MKKYSLIEGIVALKIGEILLKVDGEQGDLNIKYEKGRIGSYMYFDENDCNLLKNQEGIPILFYKSEREGEYVILDKSTYLYMNDLSI